LKYSVYFKICFYNIQNKRFGIRISRSKTSWHFLLQSSTYILTHKAYVKILQTLLYNTCLWCRQYLQINRKKALWLLFLLFIWKGSNNNYYYRGTDGIQNIEKITHTYIVMYIYLYLQPAAIVSVQLLRLKTTFIVSVVVLWRWYDNYNFLFELLFKLFIVAYSLAVIVAGL